MPSIPGLIQSTARRLRLISCALGIFAVVTPAFAQDFPSPSIPPMAAVPPGSVSVGPATVTRWSGFYLGGQFGYGELNGDFSKTTQPLLAASLRELALENDDSVSTWGILGNGSGNATGYGGFVGYNTQWQDLIVGLEGNYTRTTLTAIANSSPLVGSAGRIVSAGTANYSVNLTGAGQLEITDYASLRARAGWVLGNFLPYGFAGVVLGRGSYSVTSEVYGQQAAPVGANPAPTLPCTPTPGACVNYDFANSSGGNGVLLYGLSIGGGLDMALTPNIFLRGEVEFIQFATIGNISASIMKARVGAGFKF